MHAEPTQPSAPSTFPLGAPVFNPHWVQGGKRGLSRAFSVLSSRAGHVSHGLSLSGKVVAVAGLAVEARYAAKAAMQSWETRSPRPSAAHATKTLTTASSAWLGAKVFGAGGAWLGLGLGPGAVVTTALGATLGGCVGHFTGSWIARRVERRSAVECGSWAPAVTARGEGCQASAPRRRRRTDRVGCGAF